MDLDIDTSCLGVLRLVRRELRGERCALLSRARAREGEFGDDDEPWSSRYAPACWVMLRCRLLLMVALVITGDIAAAGNRWLLREGDRCQDDSLVSGLLS